MFGPVSGTVNGTISLRWKASPLPNIPAKICAAALSALSYGKFVYFNGGDLTTGAPGTWQEIDTPVGLVTGPVDVCKANHHAYYDAMGVPFLQAVRPRVHIIQVWSPSQPAANILARMLSSGTYPGPPRHLCHQHDGRNPRGERAYG